MVFANNSGSHWCKFSGVNQLIKVLINNRENKLKTNINIAFKRSELIFLCIFPSYSDTKSK